MSIILYYIIDYIASKYLKLKLFVLLFRRFVLKYLYEKPRQYARRAS